MLAADEYYCVVSEREPDKIAWYQVLNMPRVDLRLLYGHSLGCARRIKTRSCRIFPGNFPEQRYDVTVVLCKDSTDRRTVRDVDAAHRAVS